MFRPLATPASPPPRCSPLTEDADFAGWHAPAGIIVAVSPLLMHHDARWFPDPERFDPDRWLDERRQAVPRHAYLPFGVAMITVSR